LSHEPLLTSVVGSHAHPGWFAAAIAAAQQGEYGPADLAELLDDGVDLAIRDQERAGIDVISDGEMRRAGFFTAEFYRHLTGVWALPPERRLGAGAHDGLHRFAVDEPSPAIHPDVGADFVGLFNAAVEPAVGRARLGAHLCFGNFLGRPLAPRSYRPILEAMLAFSVDELVLEFANREMSEVGILREITDAGRDVAAGVIDVKSSYVETAADVAARIELILEAGVPPERLTLVPDCGFSQTARHLATAKLEALVAGRDLVRDRLPVGARA